MYVFACVRACVRTWEVKHMIRLQGLTGRGGSGGGDALGLGGGGGGAGSWPLPALRHLGGLGLGEVHLIFTPA